MSEVIQSLQVSEKAKEQSSLERMSSIMTLLAMLVLPCSVVFDWAYFSRLGLNMSQVPTSLSDHARSVVIWAPALGFVMLGALMQHLVTRRLDGWRDPAESRRRDFEAAKNSNVVWRWITFWVHTPGIYVITMTVIGVASFVWLGSQYFGGMLVFLSLSWVAFAFKLLPSDGAAWVEKYGWVLVISPLVVALSFVVGDSRAIENLKEKPSATIVLSNKDVLPKLVILRYLDRGVLVKKLDGHLMFVQWTAIAQVDDARARSPFEGVRCKWFGKCDEVKYLLYQSGQ
ncbi:hypothetical protein WK92_06270 [Burkholderia ubonensis]|uniref:hypothetical protein n=1 Tax=Burkholderia ubonensis TaxID=101571 RepID=UPI00075CB788|nr:hypothetical protein [Burkholderia ubonensis]KVV42936.1 hypothetical protein WK82_21035 [Burkholderia ubonensis]KVW26109.1 hypothetical protein WK92_06270 [Burkholderia ubonensis]